MRKLAWLVVVSFWTICFMLPVQADTSDVDQTTEPATVAESDDSASPEASKESFLQKFGRKAKSATTRVLPDQVVGLIPTLEIEREKQIAERDARIAKVREEAFRKAGVAQPKDVLSVEDRAALKELENRRAEIVRHAIERSKNGEVTDNSASHQYVAERQSLPAGATTAISKEGARASIERIRVQVDSQESLTPEKEAELEAAIEKVLAEINTVKAAESPTSGNEE
jgi:hypothetical protein